MLEFKTLTSLSEVTTLTTCLRAFVMTFSRLWNKDAAWKTGSPKKTRRLCSKLGENISVARNWSLVNFWENIGAVWFSSILFVPVRLMMISIVWSWDPMKSIRYKLGHVIDENKSLDICAICAHLSFPSYRGGKSILSPLKNFIFENDLLTTFIFALKTKILVNMFHLSALSTN